MIMEKRNEVMASTNANKSNHTTTTTRTAHFLKPHNAISTDHDNDVPTPSHKNNTTNKYKNNNNDWPFKVSFIGWRHPQKKWKAWVDAMHALHQSTWKQAGIYEAVLNSTNSIHRDNAVIYELAKRWCPHTNTFVLPWGEVTITLEDIMVLGGYSVIGSPVYLSIETQGEEEHLLQLIRGRQEVTRSKAQKACQYNWLNKFMGSGSEIEHQSFLALWLSRFVFPLSTGQTISRNVFPIAIMLAKGTKVALAPSLLASLYHDLSLLKHNLMFANTNKSLNIPVKLRVPLQILQIWIWERFTGLSPRPNPPKHGQPRFGRWDGAKKVNIGNVKLDSQSFRWRPFVARGKGDETVSYKLLYSQKESYVRVDCELNEEYESWARCLRVSELVGLENDTIEAYLPHRVAMQFGFDQDVPVNVRRENTSRAIAWRNYTRPIEDKSVYIPSSLSEPNVTVKYLEWWKRERLGEENGDVGLEKRKSTSASKSSTLKVKQEDFGTVKLEVVSDVPPGFRRKFGKALEESDDDEDEITLAERMRAEKNANGVVPPVFRPKCSNAVEAENDDIDNIPLARRKRTVQKMSGVATTGSCPTPRKLASYDKDRLPKAQGISIVQRSSDVDVVNDVPPGFRCKFGKALEESDDDEDEITLAKRTRAATYANGVAPPGFRPKCSNVVEAANDDIDNIPLARRMRTVQKMSGVATHGFCPKRRKLAANYDKDKVPKAQSISTVQRSSDVDVDVDVVVPPGCLHPKRTLVDEESDDEDNSGIPWAYRTTKSGKGQSTKLAVDNVGNAKSEHLTDGSEAKTGVEIATDGFSKEEPLLSNDSNDDIEKEGSSSNHVSLNDEMMNGEAPNQMEPLEARIHKLEKVVGQLKASRAKYLGNRFGKNLMKI